jgi:thymidylate kinase
MNIEQTAKLEILSQLFQGLNAQGIRYCHWKSTHSLDKALRGGTDLDLLVDRADATRFREMLLGWDLKPFVSAPQRQYPAVEDYLGFDRQTGALVHLHVHYRLVLGEQYTKNYVLPLEKILLENTHLKAGVRVPTPELETIILVLRSLLKYRDRDVLRDLLRLPGRGGLPASTLKEIDGLLAQTDLDRLAAAVKCHMDFLPPDLILDFVKTIRQAPRDGARLVRLRGHVRRVLSPYQRVGRLGGQVDYYRKMAVQELPIKRLRDYFLADRHKKPAAGGLGVAFIGTDGAGKSTAVKQIVKWLSWRVNVHVFYMGTTHPSFVTRIMKAVSAGGHGLYAGCRRFLGQDNRVTRSAQWLDRVLTDSRMLAEGKDRYDRYLAGQRKTAQGAVVIYERYPLEAVYIDGRPMDGPRIAASRDRENGVSTRLARTEEDLYKKIRPPDRILVLRVRPEVSLARKPEHRRERIEAKAQALADFAQDGLNVTEINAEQPLDQVLLQIKSAIWSWI